MTGRDWLWKISYLTANLWAKEVRHSLRRWTDDKEVPSGKVVNALIKKCNPSLEELCTRIDEKIMIIHFVKWNHHLMMLKTEGVDKKKDLWERGGTPFKMKVIGVHSRTTLYFVPLANDHEPRSKVQTNVNCSIPSQERELGVDQICVASFGRSSRQRGSWENTRRHSTKLFHAKWVVFRAKRRCQSLFPKVVLRFTPSILLLEPYLSMQQN